MHLAGLPVGDTLQSKEHHYSQMQAASFILGVALLPLPRPLWRPIKNESTHLDEGGSGGSDRPRRLLLSFTLYWFIILSTPKKQHEAV